MIEEAVDKCVQCGFCLQSCPTYRISLNEESSPRGRIALVKAVIEGRAAPDAATLDTFSECLGCRACEMACPSGVPYEEVFRYGREALAKAQPGLPWYARILFTTIASPEALVRMGRLWRRLGRAVLAILAILRPTRPPFHLLAVAPKPSSVPEVIPDPQAEVAVHRGCLMDVLWPRTNARAVLLLREVGMKADLLGPEAGCCGALHAHQGDTRTARALATRTIEAFEASGATVLVSLAGGCGAHMKEYPGLFEDDRAMHERAKRLSDAVRDVSSLILEGGAVPIAEGPVVTYQDSCHLRNGLGVWREPRRLLAGPSYCEMAGADRCCGSAGIYNLLRTDRANQLLREKMGQIVLTGAETVVVTNPGCELQLRLGRHLTGTPLKVEHLVDHLFESKSRGSTP